MYSGKINALLKGIKEGQEIQVETNSKIYKGILMPRSELGSPVHLIIKLDNGYNVGLKWEPAMKIKLAGKPLKEAEKEYKTELGKARITKVEFDKSKPPISIITTGGTITSKVDYKTGGVTSLMSPEELLSTTPELADFVNVKHIDSPFRRMSESMGVKDWQELAEVAAKHLNTDEKGVIITHGTDALHFSASALSFMLPNLSKPVILTGSQRSTDRGSTDGPINLICSSHIAVSDIAHVGICMHGSSDDSYCYFMNGTKVRKMHTSRRNAFRPINTLPLAAVWPNGKIQKMSEHNKRTDAKVKPDTAFEEKVALIKFAPNMNPDIIDYFVSKKYKGIVIEAMGLGQIATDQTREKSMSWLGSVKKAVDGGVVVCFAPQTIYGELNQFVYAEGRAYDEAGIVSLKDMLPETAYIKLGWVLGHTKDQNKAKEMMLTNYAGEISSRILEETYLY